MPEKDIQLHFRLAFSRSQLKAGLTLAIVLGSACLLRSETITLTTSYPSPSGIYRRLITTMDTFLARDGGKVGIGTTEPNATLDVKGNMAIGAYAGTSAAPADGMIVSGKVGIGTSDPKADLEVVRRGKVEEVRYLDQYFPSAHIRIATDLRPDRKRTGLSGIYYDVPVGLVLDHNLGSKWFVGLIGTYTTDSGHANFAICNGNTSFISISNVGHGTRIRLNGTVEVGGSNNYLKLPYRRTVAMDPEDCSAVAHVGRMAVLGSGGKPGHLFICMRDTDLATRWLLVR